MDEENSDLKVETDAQIFAAQEHAQENEDWFQGYTVDVRDWCQQCM